MREKKKQPHIKRPLNAFMLFMKEQRAKVAAECSLKESAAINQILGRRVSIVYSMSLVMRKPGFFAYAKTKTQISFAVTAKLISAFVFAT